MMARRLCPSARTLVAAGSLVCVLLLAGCGTSIKGMLSKQGQTFWESEQLVEHPDAQGSEQLAAFLDAEDAKVEQCRRIDGAVSERMQKDTLPFWEQLWSDLTQLVALVVPIPVVERCAAAHDDYHRALERLRESLPSQVSRN